MTRRALVAHLSFGLSGMTLNDEFQGSTAVWTCREDVQTLYKLIKDYPSSCIQESYKNMEKTAKILTLKVKVTNK